MEFLALLKQRYKSILVGITLINISIINSISIENINDFPEIVKIGSAICNLIMGFCIVFSRNPMYTQKPFKRPYWLGMLITNIIIAQNTSNELHIFSISIFLIGLTITIISAINLGFSFAITPMIKKIKINYLYKFIRHPVYLGETIMIIACVMSNINALTIAILILCLLFVILRIKEEENILSKTLEYKRYSETTKFKLVPYIW